MLTSRVLTVPELTGSLLSVLNLGKEKHTKDVIFRFVDVIVLLPKVHFFAFDIRFLHLVNLQPTVN